MNKSILLTQNDVDQVIEEIKAFLGKLRYSDTKIVQFTEAVRDIFDDYLEIFSKETQVTYTLRNHLGRVELVIRIPGEKFDPFEDADTAEERTLAKKIRSLQISSSTDIQYTYLNKCNIIAAHIPNDTINTIEEQIHRMPIAVAIVLALITGLVCRQLPSGVNEFLTEDLASSILNVLLKVTAGVFGPIMFISLVMAINVLDNIRELTSQGTRIFRCFFFIAVTATIISLVTAVIIFPITGNGDVKFDPSMIVDLILQVIPTNLISPFVDNNFPQMVVLGIIMGAALLILGEKAKILLSLLSELKDWLNQVLILVIKVMPLVTFLSIFRFVAAGKMDVLIRGAKFIVAFYICMAVNLLLKFAQTSFKCKTGIPTLFRKSWPPMKSAFVLGSEYAVINQTNEMIEKDMGVAPAFLNLWVPLNQALLAPSCTAGYVIALFFAAELVGTPASMGFILILFMLTIELSLASPGLTAGWTILFHSLGLPTDYIGLLSAFRVATRNGESAYSIAFRILEVTEEAYETGNINPERLRSRG